jgi:hypothetical protein
MIQDFEKNPVGLFLIDCDGGNPALFLSSKAAGTLVVLFALETLNRRSQRLACPIAVSIALFPSGLLIFLQTG